MSFTVLSGAVKKIYIKICEMKRSMNWGREGVRRVRGVRA